MEEALEIGAGLCLLTLYSALFGFQDKDDDEE
jgi:hypothetical protein